MTGLSHMILLAGLAAIFLVLSIFQAAVNSLSRLMLSRMRDDAEGGLRARLLREAAAPPPSRLRVAVQVGRQLCLIGAAVAAARLAEVLGAVHPLLSGFIAVVFVFTILIEQIGARAAVLINPESAFRATLPAAAFVYFPLIPLAEPLYRLLLWVREASRRKDEDEEPNEEDVRAYLDVGEEEGILEAEEGSLVESVIDFTGTLVREVMTPRTEITAVPEGASLAELIEFVAKSRHSRIPIFRGSIDHILGFVNTRDLFVHWGKDENLRASEMARPVHVVPETKRVSELLRELQASRQQLAIVVDEYGGTAGLVTIEDLLEEIVGEIRDEHEPEDVMGQADGSKIVRGRLDVVRAGELFDADLEGEGFETVGGLVEAHLGHIPEVGEKFTWRGIGFEVTDVDRRRIRRVRMWREPTHVAENKAAAREPSR
jgi:putative hemolysin